VEKNAVLEARSVTTVGGRGVGTIWVMARAWQLYM
jgi:hypothetical protein